MIAENLIHDLEEYRHFLEDMWHRTHKEWDKMPDILSTHMCRYTCLFLQHVLQKDKGISAQIVTGCPQEILNGTRDGQYGFQDKKGNWHDHSWLVINDIIVDLTADQFGADPIIITSSMGSKYNPSHDQTAFAARVEKLEKRANQWIEFYYNRKNNVVRKC